MPFPSLPKFNNKFGNLTETELGITGVKILLKSQKNFGDSKNRYIFATAFRKEVTNLVR